MHDPENNFSPLISLQIFYKDGIDAPSIRHNTKPTQDNGPSFSKEMIQALKDRYNDKSLDANQFFTELYAGNISIPVVDAQGNPPFELAINDKTKVNVFLAEPEDFIPDFDVDGVQSKTSFDKDAEGNITIINIIVTNTQAMDSLTSQEFLKFIFRPFFRILADEDQSLSTYLNSSKSTKIWGKIGNLERAMLREPDLYFEILDSPAAP